MLVCLHEEHTISIVHGYAKVTEKPIATAVHANVGLMHATMAIYNTWCEGIPIAVLGATGSLDASRRRSWMDWIQGQGTLIRPFVKFDDQPRSTNAAVKILVQATANAMAKPGAPVYLCPDLSLQENKIGPETLRYPGTTRYFNIS